jgi:hypothetical protein
MAPFGTRSFAAVGVGPQLISRSAHWLGSTFRRLRTSPTQPSDAPKDEAPGPFRRLSVAIEQDNPDGIRRGQVVRDAGGFAEHPGPNPPLTPSPLMS